MANKEKQPNAIDIAMHELQLEGIDPNSEEGKDFLFRANAFGIMGVQPPKKPNVSVSNVEVVIDC